jgi:hypothetical protein
VDSGSAVLRASSYGELGQDRKADRRRGWVEKKELMKMTRLNLIHVISILNIQQSA